MAPVIYFESGFQGNVQAVASKRITCEKEVQLDYPSALILQENETAVNRAHGIFLNEDSQVLGGVLLTAEHPDFRKPIRLELLHGTIGGLVYNSGETDVQGKIIGSLYTNAISLYAGGGSYGNHLLNATISYDQLPNDFAIPRWIKSEEESTPIILACF